MGKKNEKRSCYTCGESGHLTRDCPTTRCHYCGRQGHIARSCPYESRHAATPAAGRPLALTRRRCHCRCCCRLGQTTRREDSFIFCTAAASGPTACFARRFIVPLHRAAPDFDLGDLTAGRVDVGCRCASAAFFRSQSLRHNTELRLCFGGGEERTLCLSGGLIRNLTPDEKCISSRMRGALQAADPAAALVSAEATGELPTEESLAAVTATAASDLRGFRVQRCGMLETLADMLQHDSEPEPEPEPESEVRLAGGGRREMVSIVILLSEQGESVSTVMEAIKDTTLTASAGT
jgi:hypothetical protein